jgi:aminoglycoside phosphotransferase (APT) family kinase protein
VHVAVSALLMMHSFELPDARRKAAGDDLRRARKRAALLEDVGAGFAQQVDALIDSMEALSEELGEPATDTLIHGDFNPDQLLVNGVGAVLLDLDSTSLSDPALDVGNFMAELRRAVISRPSLHDVPQVFLAEYLARSGRKSSAARAHLQEAVSLLSTALRKFEGNPRRQQREGDQSISAVLIGEVEACLRRSRETLSQPEA